MECLKYIWDHEIKSPRFVSRMLGCIFQGKYTAVREPFPFSSVHQKRFIIFNTGKREGEREESNTIRPVEQNNKYFLKIFFHKNNELIKVFWVGLYQVGTISPCRITEVSLMLHHLRADTVAVDLELIYKSNRKPKCEMFKIYLRSWNKISPLCI